jgi:signal transduction histidine kinase
MGANINPVEAMQAAFPNVGIDVLTAIAQLSKVKSYPAGTILCNEGETGDTFYLIGDGHVEITKRLSEDEEKVLRTGGAGEFFGEMALLHDTVRSATVRTISDTTVIELDRTTFAAAVQHNPSMVLTLIRTMIDRMRANDAQAMAELNDEKEKVEKAYLELRKQEAQRDEFLDTLAHELRTPMTAAGGYIELIQGGMLTGSALKMGISKVKKSFNRITSLINDLLFVQEMELLDLGFSTVDIAEVLEEVLDNVVSSESSDSTMPSIVIDIGEGLPTIIADHDGLIRCFKHLLENAVKFSPEGGEVIIRGWATPTHINLEFIDHGVGIPEEFMPRLFERFERIETYKEHLFGGVGIGLPIVKHIVESHGGTINVESELGRGSAFRLHLPRDARHYIATTAMKSPEWIDLPDI